MAYMLNKAILTTAVKDIRATRLYSQIMSPSPMFTKQCSGHISTILYLGESHLIVAESLLMMIEIIGSTKSVNMIRS
jgi:hypothetical protein